MANYDLDDMEWFCAIRWNRATLPKAKDRWFARLERIARLQRITEASAPITLPRFSPYRHERASRVS